MRTELVHARFHTHTSTHLIYDETDRAGYELPDPPENADFADLPEDFQDTIADRLERGIALTAARDNAARRAHRDQVSAMRHRRANAAAQDKAWHTAELTRRRANKASLGERAGTREALSAAYLAAHRADNSGSGK